MQTFKCKLYQSHVSWFFDKQGVSKDQVIRDLKKQFPKFKVRVW